MTDYSEITQRMAEINKHRPFEGESLKQLKNYYKNLILNILKIIMKIIKI